MSVRFQWDPQKAASNAKKHDVTLITQNDDAVREVDELREHYGFDYSKAKPNRFADRFSEEAIAVVLDPDVAAVFTTLEAANQALRVLIDALGNLAEPSDLLEKFKTSTAASASSQS